MKFKKLVSVFLAIAILSGMSVSGFAENEPEVLEEDAVSVIQKSLDPNQYARLYMENGDLHIIATDKQKLSRTLSPLMARNSNINVIIDEEVAKYTYSQLSDAQEAIGKNMKKLDLFEVYVDQSENQLVMSSSNWSQDKMSKAISIAGIDSENIEFITVDQGNIDNLFFPDISVDKAMDIYKVYDKLVSKLKTSDYGAIFLYGEKVKVLAVSEEKVKDAVSKLGVEDYVIVGKAKHSKRKLDAITNIIGRLMSDHDEIIAVGVNPRENCVDVTVTSYSEELKKRFDNIDSKIIHVTVSQDTGELIA